MKHKTAGLTISSLILAILVGAVFVACGRDDAAVESYDQNAPHWVSIFPTDNSMGVPVETSISVTFDEPMSSATIVSFNTNTKECSGGVQLSRDNFASCVPMAQESFMVSGDKTSFTFSPQMPLDGFTRYKLRITNSAKDLALNRLEGEFMMIDGFETGQGVWPPDNAQGIKFLDQNTNEFEIWGTIEIMRALDETDITGYALYWGNSPGTKLPGEPPIQTFPVSDPALSFNLGSMFIPSFATHFLVYSVKGTIEQPTPTSVDIPDTVLRMVDGDNYCPGDFSDPAHFVVYSGRLFFTARDDCNSTGEELWVYDDMMSQPALALNIDGGLGDSSPQRKVVYNGDLYFQASDASGDIELWRYNDNPPAASKIDINGSGSSIPEDLIVYHDVLYFRANDGNSGNELWSYDGATAALVEDIDTSGDSSADGMTVYNDTLYFAANDGTGNHPWQYDRISTPSPVTTLLSISIPFLPFGAEFIEYDSRLFFRANDGTNGVEPWYYDGVNGYLLHDINDNSSDSSDPQWFTEYNGKLYFQAQDSLDNRELWAYDSISNSTWMVDNIHLSYSSFPSFLTVYKGMLIFQASNGVDGAQLFGYRDDDPSGKPFQISNINSGSGFMPEYMTEYNGRLYFSADDGINGKELWVFYIE